MQNILLFGAGKSSSTLIEYLKVSIEKNGWYLTIADMYLPAAQQKAGNHKGVKATALDIHDGEARATLIKSADVVVSLLPPSLHIEVAKDCIQYEKHLLTASYVDTEMEKLKPQIAEKQLFFLCEMGLDPGIDHMSAMKMIDEVKEAGGTITSFQSHCGGLIAPESDNNLWHYKITWNPANVVNAGKAGAVFKKDGEVQHVPYQQLFVPGNYVDVPGADRLAFYPNRDSISYIDLYQLPEAKTFIRTTLRHPDFILGWRSVVDAGLTDADLIRDKNLTTYREFYQHYFSQKGNAEKFQRLLNAESEKSSDIETAQLLFLGLTEREPIPEGLVYPNEILQSLLEKKLMMQSADKDRVVMLHELGYHLNGEERGLTGFIDIVGDDAIHTAMAKTVGLPLAIATELLMKGVFVNRGLFIPTAKWIYTPVLESLAAHGIVFREALS